MTAAVLQVERQSGSGRQPAVVEALRDAEAEIVVLRGDATSLLVNATPKANRLALALEHIATGMGATDLDRHLYHLAAGVLHDLFRFARQLQEPDPDPESVEAVAA